MRAICNRFATRGSVHARCGWSIWSRRLFWFSSRPPNRGLSASLSSMSGLEEFVESTLWSSLYSFKSAYLIFSPVPLQKRFPLWLTMVELLLYDSFLSCLLVIMCSHILSSLFSSTGQFARLRSECQLYLRGLARTHVLLRLSDDWSAVRLVYYSRRQHVRLSLFDSRISTIFSYVFLWISVPSSVN
jgi:hypothetical protein